MADKQNTYYISAKESRDIARSNRREIRRLRSCARRTAALTASRR